MDEIESLRSRGERVNRRKTKEIEQDKEREREKKLRGGGGQGRDEVKQDQKAKCSGRGGNNFAMVMNVTEVVIRGCLILEMSLRPLCSRAQKNLNRSQPFFVQSSAVRSPVNVGVSS